MIYYFSSNKFKIATVKIKTKVVRLYFGFMLKDVVRKKFNVRLELYTRLELRVGFNVKA